MIVPVMVISNLVLTRQIYSEQTNGAHAHYREPVPLKNPEWQSPIQPFSWVVTNSTCPKYDSRCVEDWKEKSLRTKG